MKIKEVRIEGVGGIVSLPIAFHKQMNILCGPNGIGKTTILESVAHCFSAGETNILKRHVGASSGRIVASLEDVTGNNTVDMRFEQYEPNQKAKINGRHDMSQFLLSLKTTRTFAYAPLNAIAKDAEKPMHVLFEESKNGVPVHDIKNWFVNRYLYSAHPGALSKEQIENFDLAKKCFSLLNKDFSFSRVNASTNEILVSTPGGEVYYEYLSSGFKSCLAILFGITKEIEFRFPATKAADFSGVILVDELELHLHPEWQSRIAGVLTETFPMAQFIVTTHSPHIIQSAEPNQILALENREGRVVARDLPKSDYGFKGWTLDEVLTDVMGMTDTRSDVFGELMTRFHKAIDSEDYPEALLAYEELNKSLHPTSHVRKLLRLQLATIASVE